MTQQKKVLISVPSELLAQLDGFAKKIGTSRNEAVRCAIKSYLSAKKREETALKLKEGYLAMAKTNSNYAEDCFLADCKCIASYEEKLAESE